MEKKKKKGFTLVEMIVVMAIIAILAGIAVPQVTKQIAKSKATSDIATAKVLAGAMQTALADGKTIDDKSTWTEITASDPINPLSDYIDNASSILKPKMNANYKFFYKYDSTHNTIQIGAGKDAASAVELYPNPSSSYK
jgi:type IV pilus assembly protein PilA